MLEIIAGRCVGEVRVQWLGGKSETVSQLLNLKVVWQELAVSLSFMCHNRHFQALDGAKEGVSMDGPEKELAFLHISGIAVLFGFESEVCKPPLGM